MSVQVLDTVERLLRSAQHPDIVLVERYGPGDGAWGPDVETSKVKHISGVRVTHQSTATASLWLADFPDEQPIGAPEVLPPPRQNRAPRLAIFAARLFDAARPPQLKAWRLVKVPAVGVEGLPYGISVITAAGDRVLLSASATGPTVGFEPDEEPFPDYEIPASIS